MHTSDPSRAQARFQRGFAGSALRLLLAFSLFISALPCAHAGDEGGTSASTAAAGSDSAANTAEEGQYFYNPLESLSEGGKAIFDSKGKWILLGAAGAVATARIFDKQFQSTFKGQQRFGALEKVGNKFFGTGMPGTLLGGGLWAYGNLAGKAREVSAGQAEIEALLAAQIIVSGIKYAVRRERPDGSDNLSFPSGHNTLAWTTAAVIHEFYGWKWGAVGYATGVITMVGRMGANKHWFSDTVGGAAAGIIIGGAIARAHKRRLNSQEERKWKMSLQPQFQKGTPGLLLTVSF